VKIQSKDLFEILVDVTLFDVFEDNACSEDDNSLLSSLISEITFFASTLHVIEAVFVSI
jgi:hypothetical protein